MKTELIVTSKSQALRIEYLDGIRAVAALYVMLAHALASIRLKIPVDTTFGRVANALVVGFIQHSGYSVVVFIVVSGYSLMLPVVRSSRSRLPGGLKKYLGRRAWRILPPYYLTVALALLCTLLIPGLNRKANVFWDASADPFHPDIILNNLLLIWNWIGSDGQIVSPQLWSIHIEWQIYFVFALVLLPVWRRWGSLAAVALAYGLALTAWLFLKERFSFTGVWFLGLFSLGMLAASLNFSSRPREQFWLRQLPWTRLAAIFFGVFVGSNFITETRWLKDSLLSLATICLIIYYTRLQTQPYRPKPLFYRLLNTYPLRSIGAFSYSLYLVHAPIVASVGVLAAHLRLPLVETYLVVGGLGSLLSICGAYLFYLLVERRFISSAVSPAPKNISLIAKAKLQT